MYSWNKRGLEIHTWVEKPCIYDKEVKNNRTQINPFQIAQQQQQQQQAAAAAAMMQHFMSQQQSVAAAAQHAAIAATVASSKKDGGPNQDMDIDDSGG